MDAMKPQDISLWATARLFQHVQSITPEHRESTVWMYLDTIIGKYRALTGLTKHQMMQEMEAYGKSVMERNDMSPEQAYVDYQAQLATLDELIADLPDDERTLAVFLVLNRVAPVHCNILSINLWQMMEHLDKVQAAVAPQGAPDVCAAGLH